MAEAKRSVGRPTSYRAEFCEAIQQHAAIIAEGGTDSAIAEALSVDIATIYRWKNEHPEFSEACQAVKAHVDDRVEASLFKRGIGYSHKAVKIFMPAGAAEPVYADYTEHYPPDTAAASLWLRNRRPKDWRDRVEHTGADGGPISIAVTLEEARRRAAIDVQFDPVTTSEQPALPAPEEPGASGLASALKASRKK